MRGSPKLGFITTMGDHITNFDCLSKNGGKIDLNFIDKGSVVYLPVNSPVPRLIFGELHICQGMGKSVVMPWKPMERSRFKLVLSVKSIFPLLIINTT